VILTHTFPVPDPQPAPATVSQHGPARPLRPRHSRPGATALEYLFVTSLIIVVLVGTIQYLGGRTKGMLDKSNDTITKAQKKS
jgi:Flp pilus assembly pilin Flp